MILATCASVGGRRLGLPMWTNENRARYDRSKLRYPSDLTDEEWALVAPLIPPPKPGGNKRTRDMREVVNGLMDGLSTDSNGGRSRRTCPRAARSTTISIGGTTTERCSVFIMRSTSSVVSTPGAKLVRRRPSSTARASRARKRGALHRPVGLRRGQEGQGEEAPCPGRHPRFADARPRAGSRRAGP